MICEGKRRLHACKGNSSRADFESLVHHTTYITLHVVRRRTITIAPPPPHTTQHKARKAKSRMKINPDPRASLSHSSTVKAKSIFITFSYTYNIPISPSLPPPSTPPSSLLNQTHHTSRNPAHSFGALYPCSFKIASNFLLGPSCPPESSSVVSNPCLALFHSPAK